MDIHQIVEVIENFYAQYAIPLVFLSSFIEVTPLGFTIPGGTIIFLGGFFSYRGGVDFATILISAWLGSWCTFLLAYFLGLKLGRRLVIRFHQEKRAEIAAVLLKKHGGAIITTSLIANLIRFWVSFVAGETRYNFKKFLLYSSLAALSWSALLTTIGYIVGIERKNLETVASRLGLFAWLFMAISFGVIIWAYRKEFRKDKLDNT